MEREVCDRHSNVGGFLKIAVTGANGFVGRHVLAVLKRRSISCVAVDLVTSPEESSLADRWVQLDIHHPPQEVFDLMGRPDACIHLAWSGLPHYKSLHHFESELPAQYKFLSTLVHEGLSAFVVSGTCFEYGMQTGALSENAVCQPANPYGFAKNALRRQLEFLRTNIPFALTWARLFYVYGDGQSGNSLWSQLKQAVQHGDKVFPMSGGEQLRDFLPIETVAEHLVSLAINKADAGVVNVCSGQPISVRKLVEGWIAENGWTIKPDLGRYPYSDCEPMEFWGNAKKLREILNLP